MECPRHFFLISVCLLICSFCSYVTFKATFVAEELLSEMFENYIKH